MPVVFEKLAEQLKDPLFRTAESGYDEADVQAFLDQAAARLAVLETRLAKAEARAAAAERKLSAARRFAGQGADASVLEDVVLDGQRQAEQLVVDAHDEAARLRLEAEERVRQAQASADAPELRAELDAARADVRRRGDRVHLLRADLEAVDQTVRTGREHILAGLDQQLRELAKEAGS